MTYYMCYIQLILVTQCVLGVPLPPSTTETLKIAEDAPHETQHAVCKVFTKEVEVTAKATISRHLTGICSSRNLNMRFDELHEELQYIKIALGINDNRNQYKSLDLASTSDTSEPNKTTNMLPYEYSDYSENENNIKHTKKETVVRKPDSISSSQLQYNSKLTEEISVFNDTIVQNGSEGELYFYYWKIPEIKKVLKRANIYISSPPFLVLGHTLYLQFYPHYTDKHIGILLNPVSNSFLKKHKIMFLGQRNTYNQISSKILYGIKNEDKIFKIESEMLDNDFLSSDSLLVKIKIYLNY